MDEGLSEALDAARSVLKSHIKQTRNVLAFLMELDTRLDSHANRIAQEAERNGKTPQGTSTPERLAAR